MDFKDTKPIYLQITDRIMDAILEEVYPPEGRLPSVREYATSIEVNANTVMRAYDWLQQQAIIYNKRGIGFFVLPDSRKRIIEMRRNVFFREEASYFFNRIESFGLTPNDLAMLYKDYLDKKN